MYGFVLGADGNDPQYRTCRNLPVVRFVRYGRPVLLLGYTFLGARQAMVYAGGIIVLYVFSILLTSGAKDSLSRFSKTKVGAAIVTSLAGLALVAFILFSHGFASQAVGTLNECTPSIDSIGTFMLSSDKNGYLLPFEAVSVLLLACIVASLIIARKR